MKLAGYYQVEHVKDECEDILLAMPASAARLRQADSHDLKKQYERCVSDIAHNCASFDLMPLSDHSGLLMEVVKRAQHHYKDTLEENKKKLQKNKRIAAHRKYFFPSRGARTRR